MRSRAQNHLHTCPSRIPAQSGWPTPASSVAPRKAPGPNSPDCPATASTFARQSSESPTRGDLQAKNYSRDSLSGRRLAPCFFLCRMAVASFQPSITLLLSDRLVSPTAAFIPDRIFARHNHDQSITGPPRGRAKYHPKVDLRARLRRDQECPASFLRTAIMMSRIRIFGCPVHPAFLRGRQRHR